MKPSDITYQNMTERLVELFPELKPRFREETAWLDKSNHRVVYSFVLYQHIEALLKSAAPDESHLRKLFDFLEMLVKHESADVRDIAEDSVCEKICSDEIVLQKAQRYMGPATKRYCADYMGHPRKKGD